MFGMNRVALLSGGKDSFYAAMQYWPPDLGLLLVYKFPNPSPHLVNLGKSVETLLLAGIRVLIVKLEKGHEPEDTIEALKLFDAGEIIAGDVYVEDHLKYMERIAEEVGAKLREPLWGEDTEELLYKIAGSGVRAVVIGSNRNLKSWLGRVLDTKAVRELAEHAKSTGCDPLGEMGEYHTLVVHSPHHSDELNYEIVRLRDFGERILVEIL